MKITEIENLAIQARMRRPVVLADNIIGLKLGTCIEAYAQGPIAIAALVLITLTLLSVRAMR